MIFTIQLFLFFELLDFKGCALDYSETSKRQNLCMEMEWFSKMFP